MARPKNKSRFKWTAKKYPNGTPYFYVTGYRSPTDRIREKYNTRVDAIDRVAELEAEVDESVQTTRSLKKTGLSEEQLLDAETAVGLAKGESLSAIVSHHLRLKERVSQSAGVSLDTAVKFFEQHYRAETKEITIYEAVEEFVNSKSTRSDQTQKYYKKSLRLLKDNPNRPVHEFGESDIQKVLKPYELGGAYKSYKRALSVFFNWATRRRYCLENPTERMDPVESKKQKNVILTLDETKRILKAGSIYNEGVMAPSIAILLFAGLRPSELNDLKASDIKKDWIVVGGGKMAGKIKRRVPIPPVLKKWLEVFPFKGVPGSWYRRLADIKTAAEPDNWVSDIFRHTSITYQIERDDNIPAVADRNGTSIKMIELHYRDVLEDPKDCEKFWKLTPEEIKKVKLEGKLNEIKHVEWPSDTELKKLVWAKPLSHLAKDLGCTDQAIRKRCLKREIELPKNGHWQKVRAGTT